MSVKNSLSNLAKDTVPFMKQMNVETISMYLTISEDRINGLMAKHAQNNSLFLVDGKVPTLDSIQETLNKKKALPAGLVQGLVKVIDGLSTEDAQRSMTQDNSGLRGNDFMAYMGAKNMHVLTTFQINRDLAYLKNSNKISSDAIASLQNTGKVERKGGGYVFDESGKITENPEAEPMEVSSRRLLRNVEILKQFTPVMTSHDQPKIKAIGAQLQEMIKKINSDPANQAALAFADSTVKHNLERDSGAHKATAQNKKGINF